MFAQLRNMICTLIANMRALLHVYIFSLLTLMELCEKYVFHMYHKLKLVIKKNKKSSVAHLDVGSSLFLPDPDFLSAVGKFSHSTDHNPLNIDGTLIIYLNKFPFLPLPSRLRFLNLLLDFTYSIVWWKVLIIFIKFTRFYMKWHFVV